MSFSVITPGVTRDHTPQQGASATSGLTFAGQRARSNNITVDGLDNNDAAVGGVRATFSQEAVREFQVLTNSYSAEFGKASGGVVNIVTKSGTNTHLGQRLRLLPRRVAQREGVLREVRLRRATPITRDKAPYRQKQFGGTSAARSEANGRSIFMSFERLDVDANNFVTIDDSTVVARARPAARHAAGILRAAGFPVDTGNVPYAVEANQFLAKVDQQLTPSQSWSLRYNYADAFNENIEPCGGLVARSRGASLDSTDNMVAALPHGDTVARGSSTSCASSSRGATRTVDSLDPGAADRAIGDDQGGPTIEVRASRASAGSGSRRSRVERPVQVLDTLSYSAASICESRPRLQLHQSQRAVAAAALRRPVSSFARCPRFPVCVPAPISAIQAVALGLPAAYVQGYGNPAATVRLQRLSLFVQDDWRLQPNLTLKLGLRYQNQYWPEPTYTVAGVRTRTRFRPTTTTSRRGSRFAWDPPASAKTSIRGAYGIFYDNHITGASRHRQDHQRRGRACGRLSSRFPAVDRGVERPGHGLPEPAGGTVPEPGDLGRSRARDAIRASRVGRLRSRAAGKHPAVGKTSSTCAASSSSGRSTTTRSCPRSAPGRRPEDVDGPGGHVRIRPPVHVVRRDVVSRPDAFGAQALGNRYQFLASYTLSKAEDNIDRLPERVHPAEQRPRSGPADPTGLPVGFDPEAERGPSLQDQRHRFVLSGIYTAPYDVNVSAIIAVVSGRPYNIIAGVDLNGDGDGGTIPGPTVRARIRQIRPRRSNATVARCRRRRQWTCA